MGRKALVDYSLIKEICENLTISKKKFKGQLDLEPDDGSSKAGKKTEEIKRLLVSGAKKKTGSPAKKRKKPNSIRKKSPARFRQNASTIEESGSSSCSSESSTEFESDQENKFDDEDDDNLSDCDSDENTDTLGEIEWALHRSRLSNGL